MQIWETTFVIKTEMHQIAKTTVVKGNERAGNLVLDRKELFFCF